MITAMYGKICVMSNNEAELPHPTAELGPLLPGFEPPAPSPTEETAEADEATGDTTGPRQKTGLSIGRFAATALVAVLTGVAIVAAHKLIAPRIEIREVVKEVRVEPDGIPVELLPDTADPGLWETVASLSGEINGEPLQFKRGIALADGICYRVQFDFCSSGSDIYVKVVADKTYIVRADTQGKIIKAYPAPRNGKPLKELFGR